MAVAIDTSGTASASDTSSVTTSFTVVGAGSANMLVGVAGWSHNSSAKTLSSMTYNTVALTIAGQSTEATGVHAGAALCYLASPATGANNLVTTMSAATEDIVHGFMSFSGCNATQSGTANAASGTPAGGAPQPAATVTGVADGLVVGIGCGSIVTAAAFGTAETQVWEGNSAVNQETTASAVTQTGTGSVTLDWSGVPNFNTWSAVGFPLEPTAAAATAKSLALLGVG